MATPVSAAAVPTRLSARRQAMIAAALDHAEAIVVSDGAGAVTVSEIARRMGMRAPSLYKYFPSLHAIYDELFARGNVEINAFVDAAVSGDQPGFDRLLHAARAVLRWAHGNPGLAQLMFWRPVPGFTPSAESFVPSQALWDRVRSDLTAAVRRRELSAAADSDDVMRMLTMTIAGVLSQQMSNEPDADFDTGVFTKLSEQMLTNFFSAYRPQTRKGRA